MNEKKFFKFAPLSINLSITISFLILFILTLLFLPRATYLIGFVYIFLILFTNSDSGEHYFNSEDGDDDFLE